MKFAAFGRTQVLLDSVLAATEAGHESCLIGTCMAEPEYNVDASDFEALAKRLECPFFDDVAINGKKYLALVREAGPDVAISVNWLTCIGREMRELFAYGVLNGHAGDLPRYRGNACPNWAILEGERHIAVTVHQMGDGIDDGPVVLKRETPLTDDTYIGDVYDFIGQALPEMFVEAINGLADGSFDPQSRPQDPTAALRCYPRRPEDGHINWSQPVEMVHRLVRASSKPFAGAFTTLDGHARVTIWRAEIYEHPGAFLAVPGQVMVAHEGDPVIACGEGALLLTEVACEGADGPDAARSTILRSLRNRLQ